MISVGISASCLSGRVLGHHQFREEEDAWPNSGLWEVRHWQGKYPCSYGVWWSVALHSMSSYIIRAAGIAHRLECRTHDWKVTGLNPCRSGGRIFFFMVNFLCWLLFRYPFHPHVTAVACKRSAQCIHNLAQAQHNMQAKPQSTQPYITTKHNTQTHFLF